MIVNPFSILKCLLKEIDGQILFLMVESFLDLFTSKNGSMWKFVNWKSFLFFQKSTLFYSFLFNFSLTFAPTLPQKIFPPYFFPFCYPSCQLQNYSLTLFISTTLPYFYHHFFFQIFHSFIHEWFLFEHIIANLLILHSFFIPSLFWWILILI